MGSLGESSGLCSVSCAEEGAVLMDPEDVRLEFFTFCKVIFQGRHAAAEEAEAPTDRAI